jgi:hypothetical protein
MVVHRECNVKLVVHRSNWRESDSSWGEKLMSPNIYDNLRKTPEKDSYLYTTRISKRFILLLQEHQEIPQNLSTTIKQGFFRPQRA